MTGSLMEKFDNLKYCVIIPTYNNAATLANVIEDVAQYSNHIIVINDGSTDNTVEIVNQFPAVQFISYTENVGKGWALRPNKPTNKPPISNVPATPVRQVVKSQRCCVVCSI